MKRLIIAGVVGIALFGIAFATANFPASVSTDANLYVAVNNCYTTLSVTISASTPIISAITTANFPSVGYILIENEAIKYTAKTGVSFTGCTRGSDGTSATTHASGKSIYLSIIAAHHNVLKDEVKAIESYFLEGSTIHIDTTNVRVGINNATPAHTLDVGGSIYSSSQIVCNRFGAGTTAPTEELHILDGTARYENSLLSFADAASTDLVHVDLNSGSTEMALSLRGMYASGRSRTALDLRPPSETWASPGVTEILTYGTGDGGAVSPYHRLLMGFNCYRNQFYSMHEESGTGESAHPITFSLADHTNGVNVESMKILGWLTEPGSVSHPVGRIGSVVFGEFSQKTGETAIDYDPYDMVILHPNDLIASGYKDSHGLVFSGNGYDSVAHRSDVRLSNVMVSSAGASRFTISNRIDSDPFVERVTLSSVGDFGVNVSTPQEKLHVKDGNILLENGQFQFEDDASTPLAKVYLNTGDTEMALSLTGLYASGRSRTAFDVRCPSETWADPGVTELQVYGKGDGGASSPYHRFMMGFDSYWHQAYSIHQESGEGENAHPITFSVADHTNGINVESMKILGYLTEPGSQPHPVGRIGSVVFGEFSQKTGETVTDYEAYDMVILHPNNLVANGKTNSHGLVWSANGYTSSAFRNDWRANVVQTSSSTESYWNLASSTNSTTFYDRLTVTNTGYVGIGTTNPAYGLDVYKDEVRINSPSSNPVLRLDNNGTTAGLITGSNTLGLSLESNGALSVIVQTNSLERIRIDENGYVGISTSNPQSTLDVAGNIMCSSLTVSGSYGATGLQFTGALGVIHTDTVDGSDSKALSIGSGGISMSQSRGAGITLYGNEHGSLPGKLTINAGDASGNGTITFNTASTTRMTLTYDGLLLMSQMSSPEIAASTPSITMGYITNTTIGMLCISTGTTTCGSYKRVDTGGSCQ